MCVNKKRIFNRYSHHFLYVDCGKCPACLQKRANKRAARIRAERKPSQMALFVHLKYLNECVPYVKREDLKKDAVTIPVYRDYDRSYHRVPGKKRRYKLFYKRCYSPIASLALVDPDTGVSEFDKIDDFDSQTKSLLSLQKTYHPRWTTQDMSDKIGICYYKDLQNFIKKLKLNLQRLYGLPSNSFSFYATSEYGGQKSRPHFHLLLFFERSLEEQFRNAILKSWSYAFRGITERRLEEAVDAAKYIATYVNKPSTFSQILSCPSFREKKSTSQGFGLSLRAFQLDSILEKISRGDMRYTRTIYTNSTPVKCDVPLPTYVISHYFPKFKGFSRLIDSEISRIGRSSYSITGVKNWLPNIKRFNSYWYVLDDMQYIRKIHPELNYTDEDINKIVLSIINHADRCYMSVFDYMLNWCAAWRAYYSTLEKYLYENRSPLDSWFIYDNIEDYFTGDVRNDSLDELLMITPNDFEFQSDPNNFPENVALTELLTSQFEEKVKQHSINGVAESLNFEL